ncbi:tetratricopeptide repeat protein [Candidatus Desantisbacteria bacterium]|nr:tetratricopeptide repeat protein [Candidatus Desantisbacteria bacterium]
MPISVEDHKKAEVHNALGVIYRKKGKYDRAIEEYEKALHFDPEYTLAYSNLGFIYYRKSMYDKAMEYYKKAIEIDPSYVLAYNKLGVVYRKKGLYKKALEVYKKAIEISPDYAEIYYNMAVVYRYMKKYSEASEMYKKVIEFRPEYIPAHVNLGLDYKYSGEYDKAIEEYEKVLKLDPNYVEIFINFGIAYFLKKEYDKAIEQLSLSIEKDKNNPLSYYYLGMTYEATGDFEKALDAYNKTYEVEPNFPNLNDKTMDVHLKIGDRLLSEKKYKEAKEEYKLAWECKNDPPIYLKIARIDELSESWEEAVNSYQRLEKINPEGPKYKEKIKELLLHAGDNAILANQYTKAIEYYKRILMDFPDELDIRYRLGEAFLAIEKNDDAFQEFNYIFKKDPDFPDIKTKVDELSFSGIFILIKNKQFDEAIVRCKDMLARYPDNLEALYGLGTIYAGKDMTNEAIEIFEKIADRDMKFKNVKLKLVQLYTNRAEAYFEKIHYQEAFDQYKKIIQIDPENIECLYKVAVLYDRRKKSDEAIEYYEKVYQKVKNYKDVSEKLKAI